MIERDLKPGWKVWRFDQMATNVNVRIDNPSESGMEHYVGLEHLDADSLKIRRWGTPDDVEATKLMFKKGDIIFGRRRAYQRKLGVAEFDPMRGKPCRSGQGQERGRQSRPGGLDWF